mmetsp:Transcript_15335/g.55206  ORF Transcript_15335/g.55206 Transcript_15335/m.55206 type:complete len:165 (-) Transcript_15335:384-878(-)
MSYVAVERFGVLEHSVHVCDRTHVPTGDIAVEGCVAEHRLHARDFAHIPFVHVTASEVHVLLEALVDGVLERGPIGEGAVRDISKWRLCTNEVWTSGMFTGANALHESYKPYLGSCQTFYDRNQLKKAVDWCISKVSWVYGCSDMNNWDVSRVASFQLRHVCSL